MWTAWRRLFTAYPGGLPGAGLLLLRVSVGSIVALNAGGSVVLLAACTLLLAGLFTPLASLAMAATLALSLYRSATPHTEIGLLTLTVVCAAIAMLGPGVWSLDARLFGRREIAIPRRRL
jgi:uncharacterized membrane protein YphA (DoxX/SURF4 family)